MIEGGAQGRNFWTSGQLRAAIERCNLECATMIARHEPPEKIESRRKGIEMLHRLLQNAERAEREASRA